MRPLPVIALAAVLVGAGAYVFLPTSSNRVDPDLPEARPDDAAPAAARRTPATGKLVVRVRTADGTPLPAGTEAGYLHQGMKRLRRAASDGTFPFYDAPVGAIEAIAEAPGYTAKRVAAQVVAGVDATEPVVVLTADR